MERLSRRTCGGTLPKHLPGPLRRANPKDCPHARLFSDGLKPRRIRMPCFLSEYDRGRLAWASSHHRGALRARAWGRLLGRSWPRRVLRRAGSSGTAAGYTCYCCSDHGRPLRSASRPSLASAKQRRAPERSISLHWRAATALTKAALVESFGTRLFRCVRRRNIFPALRRTKTACALLMSRFRACSAVRVGANANGRGNKVLCRHSEGAITRWAVARKARPGLVS